MIRRHPVLAIVIGLALAGFGAFGFATGAKLTVPYLVIVGVGAVVVGHLDAQRPLSAAALVGLAVWGIGHLAGGIVDIGDDRILYNALLPGRIHFDNVVHFIGFGSAGLACWDALRHYVALPRLASFLVAWIAAMGVGALNEVIEFGITHVQTDTHIGGFQNTGRDLVANMLGAASAALVVVRRVRSAAVPA